MAPCAHLAKNMDVIDLTENTEMDPTPQPETLFQPGSSNFEETRKRKANDIDTYHHPLIEFEATGKQQVSYLLLYPF